MKDYILKGLGHIGIYKEEPIGVMPSMFPKPCKNAFFKGPAGERVELFDFT